MMAILDGVAEVLLAAILLVLLLILANNTMGLQDLIERPSQYVAQSPVDTPTPEPTETPTPVLDVTPGPAEGWRADYRIIAGRFESEEEAEAWAEDNLPVWMDWEWGYFFEPEGGE